MKIYLSFKRAWRVREVQKDTLCCSRKQCVPIVDKFRNNLFSKKVMRNIERFILHHSTMLRKMFKISELYNVIHGLCLIMSIFEQHDLVCFSEMRLRCFQDV